MLTRDGRSAAVRLTPRILSQSLSVHAQAAKSGGGIALLPQVFTAGMIRSGELVSVLPEWRGEEEVLHIAFTSRRGMLPAVRVFIDFAHDRLKRLVLGKCDSLVDFVDAA